MAKLTLIGRLGAQPQIQKDKQGRDILIYSVAVNDRAPPAKEDGSASSSCFHFGLPCPRGVKHEARGARGTQC
jgi:single-stranded DNA-binding protein